MKTNSNRSLPEALPAKRSGARARSGPSPWGTPGLQFSGAFAAQPVCFGMASQPDILPSAACQERVGL